MKITYFGTTTLLFDDGKDQILFDCHFTRPSLVSYISNQRVTSDIPLINDLMEKHHVDRLKAVFISHTHHDHVMDMPYVVNRCGADVYGSPSAVSVARGGGVPDAQIFPFHAEETYQVGAYKIKVLNSVHSKPTILNNDIGEPIVSPLQQPARLHDYKEGGSYDFYVEAEGKRFLIRPSFNYIPGQLDGYEADVLFLGVAGLGKADAGMEKRFFEETLEKVHPKLVIPVHWDNFFLPLSQPAEGMIPVVEKTETVFHRLMRHCEDAGISCIVQIPRTFIEI